MSKQKNNIIVKPIKIQIVILSCVSCMLCYAQQPDTEYKKKVLETVEVDYLMSYYTQDGTHASVTGGVGDEHLTDVTPTFVVRIPLNDDDVLTVDAGISAYTSASSSNLDPFDASGASRNGGGPQGSPWVESSGASRQDVWGNIAVGYSHSSEDRNRVWGANASFSAEYDYRSIGFGGNYNWLFNQKNTEIGLKGWVYLDQWLPRYPTELDSYLETNGNLNLGFFTDVPILDQNGNAIDKNGPADAVWSPFRSELVTEKQRNTYSISASLSQIISQRAQFSVFLDVVRQEGWLANPMQRVYFDDRANYYIGNAASIPNYTFRSNTDVFQLADDIERLPDSRLKIPLGARFHYYISENIALRTYYRYYTDDWGITAHTAQIEVPIKFGLGKFTLYPTYRYYTQTVADYFAPFGSHLSTSDYYTSDYDLSEFDSHQYGLGFKYYDLFHKLHLFDFGLKNLELCYNRYDRSDGLNANIVSFGVTFVKD